MRTRTSITLEGLMVFHKDQSGLYEVGILDVSGIPSVPPHPFEITITPNPATHTGQFVLGPADLDNFLKYANEWFLEVRDSGGGALQGVQVDSSLPNRQDTDANNKRFGWIVNLESSEFHNGRLYRQSGKLKPIIHLTKGSLYTFCKTGEVDLKRNSSVTRPHFGFISAVVGFEINTSAGETVTLSAGAQEVFHLPAGYSYDVEITKAAPMAMSSHFHAYYDVLFTKVIPINRFDFQATTDHPKPSPNECPSNQMESGIASGMEGGTHPEPMRGILIPPPFKCGGVGTSDGGDPLS